MPATTVNRGYPYPLDSDLIDVTLDIRRLAEAIDFDVVALTATDVLDIRPWTGDGWWGSLVHPGMFGQEHILISSPSAPTIISAFTNQPVIIRNGANDDANQMEVGSSGFRLSGRHMIHLTPDSSFTVAPGALGQFSDHAGTCFYRPRDAAGHSWVRNSVGGRTYYDSQAHHFRAVDGTETFGVHPTLGFIQVQGVPGGNTADTQQLRVEAPTGNAGLSLVVKQASWAVILRGNPTSSLAPCLDVMDATTTTYIPVVAGAYQDLSSVRFKNDIQPVTDADLLTRVDQLAAVTWLQNKPKNEAGADMTSPYLVSRRIGLTAEALNTPFPELVGLDSGGVPLSIDAGKTATTALATIGALSRRVNTLVTRIAALEAKVP